MKKRSVAIIALTLFTAGAAVAIAQPWQGRGGHRGGGHMGGGMDLDGLGGGMGHHGRGRMGMMGPGMRLKMLDADKDGAVTPDEFLAPRAKRFGELDKNSDGAIDAAEIGVRVREASEYWTKRIVRALDENKDGKITKEEFSRRARQAFSMRDMNDDGRIDADDMPPGMRERMKAWREKRKERAEGKEGEAGKGADGAGSGSGSGAGEGRRMGRGPGAGPMTLDRVLGRVNERFATFDRNNDGVIDASDLEAMTKERVEYAQKRFLHRFDTNKDGRVSRDEFLAPARQRFAQIDLNTDGRITEEDLPPMMRGRGILKAPAK